MAIKASEKNLETECIKAIGTAREEGKAEVKAEIEA